MDEVNRRAYLDAEHRITLKAEPVPRPAPGEVLVRIRANGICGSDIHFYQEGRLGNFRVTRPYVPGHEAAGEVAEVGADVRGAREGEGVVIEPGLPCGRCRLCRTGRYNLCPDVVFLSAPPIDGTLCDWLTVRADAVHRMPEGMSFEQGALAEPAAVAVHAVNRARVRGGDAAVVLGCGPIGLLTLQAFKAAGGGRALCVDPIPARRAKARELGADEAVDHADASTGDAGGDVVFETAGSVAATAAAFAHARPGGTVVQVGWPEDNRVGLDVAAFLDKELTYVAVNRYANAFAAAVAWIADRRLDVERLITHRFPLDEVGEAFAFAATRRREVIKALVVN